jgi:enamine deaminase RidA (YjgF/YER057c/UK114 family)
LPRNNQLTLTGLLTFRVSYDYGTGVISNHVAEQAEQTMQNISMALKIAGADIKDVVRVRYILPDRADFPKTWPVLQKWFGDVRPAATMIQAGLMEEVMKIEIEVTARKPFESPAEEDSILRDFS